MKIVLPDYGSWRRPEHTARLEAIAREALRATGRQRSDLLTDWLSEEMVAARLDRLTVDGTEVFLKHIQHVRVRPGREAQADAWLKERGLKARRKDAARRLGCTGLPGELFKVDLRLIARSRPVRNA